jgi:glucose/arabinose dehydrogenase
MKTKPYRLHGKADQTIPDFIQTFFVGQLPPFFVTRGIIMLHIVFMCLSVVAQTLPPGFTRVQVANGITNPTALTFSTDGRIFVTQQNGTVRIIKDGTLLTTPFLQLNVVANGERGLICIALYPDFASNHFVYLYHTLPDASRNRISRFTANGDVAIAGSETLILNLDPLSSATNHNGGAMQFGPDGKLYVAVGDNANPNHSQNLDTYHGKLLRINKDGSVPPGNPFSGSAQKSRIWSYGLRNPYTFDFQPGTGRLFVNDVGQSSWEEINDATAGGKNFGWPLAEGTSTNPSLANPVYAYTQGSGDSVGCAITGGVFFNPANTAYPKEYWGRYFYLDYCNQWINFLDLSGSTAIRHPFASSLGSRLVYMDVGNDGNLYYLQRNTSSLFKIVYTNNSAPAIVDQPDNVTVPEGQPATFSVTATGSAPLRYQWQKNGVDITNATSGTYTITSTKTGDAGAYRVIVSNAFGNATSANAQLTVTSSNQAPKPVILTPAEGTLYRGGDTLRFSGEATDAEDGSLPASAFSWSVDFHHDAHVHDGPPVVQGAKSGYYVIPKSGEVDDNVWYRLKLTVTDSKGAKSTVIRDILPRKSVITLKTQPTGLQVALDGKPLKTQAFVTSVEGIERTISSIAPQPVDFRIYDFDRWLHGGAATQTIITPVNDVAYTAVYKESPFSATRMEAETAQLSGAVVSSTHSGFTGSGFVDYINASGDYIEWTVNAASAGTYEISFQYALATGPRSLQIRLNGTIINSSFSFPATGSWSAWAAVSLPVQLNAGVNKIRATAIGSSGPNIDYLIVTPQTLQAEYAVVSGPKVLANHPGYTGTGFVDYINNSGDYVEWLVYKHMAGAVTLNFRYANGATKNRPLAVWVNGTVIAPELAFPPTGGWNQWANTSISVSLKAGINRVRLTAIGSSGPNIDYLSWSSQTSSTMSQAVMVSERDLDDSGDEKQGLSVIALPNPASGMVRLQAEKLSASPVTVTIIGSSGKVYKNLLLKGDRSGVLQVPINDVPSGLYLVIVEQGATKGSVKLVISHQ